MPDERIVDERSAYCSPMKEIEDFPQWKTGGTCALVALLALVLGFYGPALVLALIGAGFMLSAYVAKQR